MPRFSFVPPSVPYFLVGSFDSVAVEEGSNEWVDCPATLECNTACCRVVSWCFQRSYESMPPYYPLVARDIRPCGVSCKSISRNAWLAFAVEHQVDTISTKDLARMVDSDGATS
ncbi:hypothetical protein PIB30_036173 [Stylosanthes scabra]|uniref:Uncharacterized protein n=1 Tax=Stylosanthes scabra TaxID=79078 RepID=A0ABU6QDD6_9FABA|nr:hypothetical protein [Stylosanthes scabra]